MFDYINEAKHVFDIEINALNSLKNNIDEKFNEILKCIVECKGKVILTGIGKPGYIGRKIASTMASLGTPTFFLHPAEALHGDLGMIRKHDVVIAISYSGESDEITKLLPNIKLIGAKLIAITGNAESTLARFSDLVQVIPKLEEACYMNLAPTSSTTAEMVYGDALAIAASKIYGFNKNDFAMYHPAGSLGKKLIIKIEELMCKDENNPVVLNGAPLKTAIVELSRKAMGIVSIVDNHGKLLGVLTDGDIRRLLEKEANIYNIKADEVMTKNAIYIEKDTLAVSALELMKIKNVTSMPVVDENSVVVGTVRMLNILNAGIII